MIHLGQNKFDNFYQKTQIKSKERDMSINIFGAEKFLAIKYMIIFCLNELQTRCST